jgi:hypothetical protein
MLWVRAAFMGALTHQPPAGIESIRRSARCATLISALASSGSPRSRAGSDSASCGRSEICAMATRIASLSSVHPATNHAPSRQSSTIRRSMAWSAERGSEIVASSGMRVTMAAQPLPTR